MTDLPPLPPPDIEDHETELWGQNVRSDYWGAERVKKYGAACAAQEREACEIKVVAAGMRRVKSLDLREEVERLRAAAEQARAALSDTEHALTKARIWGGTEWHYNPLHPMFYVPALEKLRAALNSDALRALDAALEGK